MGSRLRWLWGWWRQRPSMDTTTEEAQAKLAEVQGRDFEVDRLSDQLHRALNHNHFSDQVMYVIKRANKGR